MVILGTGSDRDVYNALEQIKSRTMGQTHEVSTNTESSAVSISIDASRHSKEIRGNLSEVVHEADQG